MCWPLTSFGHEYSVMLSTTSHGAPRAIKLSLDLIHMVFICLFLFLVRLGRIFRWILFWDCLGLRGGEIVSVFVTGNKIYMVGRRITSMMVAQDARNKTRGLDRFEPSGGGNTLHPVCGCISLMLRRVL